jgi:hypothetical protein
MGDYASPPGPGLASLVSELRDIRAELRTLQRPSGVDVGGLLAQVQMALANITTTVTTAINALSYTRAVIDSKIANPPAGSAVTGNISATGDINLTGDLYTPHGLATPVTSGYFAAYINFDGRLGRTVSARRYKQDITAWAPDAQAVFALRLVTYRLKSNVTGMGDKAPVEVGMIAEELVALGLGWLVLYINGEVEGIAYEKIALLLLPVVQDHEKRLLALEARL